MKRRHTKTTSVSAATVAVVLLGVVGCTIAPKTFFDLKNPAPLVRARASQMGGPLEDEVVVPSLIERLDDPDSVVRLTSFDELKRRTGQDFGYKPWHDAQERAAAIGQWRAWWEVNRGNGLAKNPRIP
jgi:HEAT repeat protein